VTGAGNPTDTGAASAGAWLRAAREAAGLSEDAVAQQLKLAPRQVRAIEEDEYALLPGRTFVRGFVRNYARLLNLDADAIVATLPRGEATSPLERLTYTPASPPMGELRIGGERRSRSSSRWLIPLALLAIVAAAAVYEYMRPQTGPRRPVETSTAPAMPSSAATSALPNPLDAAKSDQADAPATGAPPMSSATSTLTAAPDPTTATALSAQTSGTGPATFLITWNGPSWVEVRDGAGATLVSQTGSVGSSYTVSGKPPFDLVIGNAANVALSVGGQPFDFSSHVRYNVARFSLR